MATCVDRDVDQSAFRECRYCTWGVPAYNGRWRWGSPRVNLQSSPSFSGAFNERGRCVRPLFPTMVGYLHDIRTQPAAIFLILLISSQTPFDSLAFRPAGSAHAGLISHLHSLLSRSSHDFPRTYIGVVEFDQGPPASSQHLFIATATAIYRDVDGHDFFTSRVTA
ncbi:hypothetical protein GYMLUDRAFT_76487 [Collybiopsis luxurians FD-317 M1]|uniref:Uncharacterized protein n=1 Tax=Collybiopsis luxurians FD-317 M1 TaxID=944289 RepID=A0A0D0CKF3_9AGAR|nr:hypothetical protein GYMLUDRAFT_76487 [Collybiopsis luxurians FD-317 M1]